MSIVDGGLPGLKLFTPLAVGDVRGSFCEVYRRDIWASAGIDIEFVQDNQSISTLRGTVRGLHFQSPPYAQAKLVRVLEGAIFDVAVDIRRGSPTYGRHAVHELSAQNGLQFLIPEGFAHGFCTLTERTSVHYKVSAYYSAAHDRGLLWRDPDLQISWPVATDAAVLSDRDRGHPGLATLNSPFV
jgi:dTDP-4-dehydrorhamnose 3,5-epimerase